MEPIIFFDIEGEPNSKKILDVGGVKSDGSLFHSNSVAGFIKFIKGLRYLCGHNILNHDLRYIKASVDATEIDDLYFIDTLYLSPLMFPTRPYHALLKDDKLQTEDANNPLNDSMKARDLFFDEVAAFQRMDNKLKRILYFLLKDKMEFSSFFLFLGYTEAHINIEKEIQEKFKSWICEQANLGDIITQYSVELAYCLALINANSKYSITPPWVLRNFPAVEHVMFLLRRNPCIKGCAYCNKAFDIHMGLKQFFGFDSYRTYAGEALQEKAARAAIENKSLLAVFPTGGGKSITFQVPALMSGINSKGLTVVISPLQSLMKDQVDNLEKAGIPYGVTINGLLDPIERAKSFERVENGSAYMLYLSPEALRSKTIERLLLGRNIVRFVIDEAHCFSSWGQDFRVDYLYIGDFIKSIQQKKNLQDGIPVSCFTATAKRRVVEDIRSYFKEKLSIEMEVFRSGASRSNLSYKVLQRASKEEKYNTLRDLLEQKSCPVIIYVSRTGKANSLAQRLMQDGYTARPYHGKMDSRKKIENQDSFIRGEVRIMVATSAFGMGVDKKDVGMVIHYDISDSLENYVQEAGRAGRDENISADCFVLFDDEDLNKHFMLLNQNKLSIQEIQQIWKAIKDITRFRLKASQSALEIARRAGWDDSIAEIETKVKTAIAALEDAGYLKRGYNMPRIFASSILARNAEEAIGKINASDRFDAKQKVKAVRIIKGLFSSRSRKHLGDEEAESRVDYISDRLGIVKEEVIKIVNLLREERILADTKDLTAFIKKRENVNRSLDILKSFRQIERFFLSCLDGEEKTFHIKELNERAEENGCEDVNPDKIKTIVNFWAIKGWIRRQISEYSKNHITVICMQDTKELEERLAKRHELAHFILEYLYSKVNKEESKDEETKEEALVEFSVLELKEEFEGRLTLLDSKASVDDIEDSLFYLSRIQALKIEGGFMVVYNALTIERIEKDTKKRYKMENYQKLSQFYHNKMQQIHIVGEYARTMLSNYKAALQFVDDYFQLNYSSFLNKYFKGSRQDEIKRNITPAKFRQLFGELSPTQLKIITDNESKYIVVAAGPGSGKTRILVHKLASLLLMEDVKHEQLLMLTFSRAAATEFKKRLLKLIGNAANFVEIKTFHSYCFDLLGKVGNVEKSDEVISETIKRIKGGEVEAGRITKTVLVIDEAQDMDANEFNLISALMEHNEDMRVIAVGDDDQNIFEFRGASSKHLESLAYKEEAVMYELVENYRSKSNLVDFANQYASRIPHRLKKAPIIAAQSDIGKIELVRYTSGNLVIPLVKDILSEGLAGTSCILTKTNEEALQISGMLIERGLKARLIQSNDGFNFNNLMEIRFFQNALNLADDIYIIDDDIWGEAKKKLENKFKGSLNLDVCTNMFKDFETANPKNKYRSDFETFIRESRFEDFCGGDVETVFVSTIHKSKGREFDNVFLMLDGFNAAKEEAMRQLYVAVTRAKQKLSIHCNGNYFDFIKTDGLKTVMDSKTYLQPDKLAAQLTFKDVWLDFFQYCQKPVSHLMSGDRLGICEDGCRDVNGRQVLKFSKNFIRQTDAMKKNNYAPVEAKIRFIVYWKKENSENEIKVILPEIYFSKTKDNHG
ncbi:ATP-dependent DNA helicase RecQ [Anaerobacterium chartisolvens]|uniref:ATP-dependent DNA helicase RecQ n=1 Tax=Anaerobacterium chartisolvens TaxID=1297424 RepID=A0A369B7M0_9FIRM|nr:RecQ family ATP-dependent DNA helicase [Anaerobacterium chartisolvens]RCX16546.1 ATP-dependent DNA helicase RecQ [Anaerobacterium chartisolvens]